MKSYRQCKLFIAENDLENVCKMAAILSQHHCVSSFYFLHSTRLSPSYSLHDAYGCYVRPTISLHHGIIAALCVLVNETCPSPFRPCVNLQFRHWMSNWPLITLQAEYHGVTIFLIICSLQRFSCVPVDKLGPVFHDLNFFHNQCSVAYWRLLETMLLRWKILEQYEN